MDIGRLYWSTKQKLEQPLDLGGIWTHDIELCDQQC